ncbi:hypothetical protein [Gymnodinialimonas sp.]
MTTFNTNTDLNARGRQLAKTREAAEHQVWRLLSGLPALFTRRAVDPEEAIAKAERREAARRAVDNLLR